MLLQYLFSVVALLANVNASKHKHQKEEENKKIAGKGISSLFRRNVVCQFPTDKGLVPVQTSGKNAGWAMHSDQQCTAGSWCPYACPPGQLMGQWDPAVTSYTYPGSQYGGLWCNEDGELEEQNSGKSYCYSGKGTVIAKNSCGSNVAFCQTVLPGNEEMLIPSDVGAGTTKTLAVPGTDYWAGTAAHYYINPPGVSVDDGCKWGANTDPYGNWAPYVAGANQDNNKNTYVKIGWNPVYLEPATPFRDTKPSFGIRITCDDESSCNGLPCEIDPSKGNVDDITSGSSSSGAGGGAFCVVTASNGAKANIEVFDTSSAAKKIKRHEHHEHAQNKVTETKTIYKTVHG